MHVSEHVDRVARVAVERRLRGWSGREAAIAGGISNTTWSKFEATGEIGDAMRRGAAKAFGWPMDWPENLPAIEMGQADAVSQLRVEVERLAGVVRAQGLQIVELTRAVRAMQGRRSGAGSAS
jgi:hypothetical protein